MFETSVRPQRLTDDEWPFASRRIDIDGHAIHYVDEGDGPVLVFVHVGFWSFVWRDVIIRLRRDFRCISMDAPGTGFSTAAPGYPNTLSSVSAVLERFVDELGLESFTLVVHDLGGPAGLALAARRPESVRGLVIAQTFAWSLADYPWVRRMIRLVSSRPMAWLNRTTAFVPRLSSGRFGVGRHLSKAGRRAFRTPFADRATCRAWSELIGGAVHIDDDLERLHEDLRRTLRDVPTLTIFGERNDPFGWQERFGRLFPRSRAVVIPKGNHFPMADDPESFASSIAQWWRDDVAV